MRTIEAAAAEPSALETLSSRFTPKALHSQGPALIPPPSTLNLKAHLQSPCRGARHRCAPETLSSRFTLRTRNSQHQTPNPEVDLPSRQEALETVNLSSSFTLKVLHEGLGSRV